MDLGFPNKQQQQQGLAFLFTLRYLWQWFSKEQSHFSFCAFYEYELFSHRSGSYPNTKCQRKWKTKHFKSSIQKKENISFFSQQKPAVITNFWPTLPTTVTGAERGAGGPKTLKSVGLLVEFPALHLHLPASARVGYEHFHTDGLKQEKSID